MLALLAVKLHVHGHAHRARPLMLVANHVSWLDIFLINAVVAVRFVAKAEIRSWPLFGWLSERVGSLFIERARRHDTARVNALVSEALTEGDVFAVFPEGMTTDGSEVLKFHASLLAPALATQAAIQPVAIRYEREDGTLCVSVAYHGERSMWDALVGMTGERAIHAHVWFLEPMIDSYRHRREVAAAVREAIALTLTRAPHCTRTETGAGLRAAAR
jgi:1-acyl-sn-glycerol-3-phosphate acyltransferase